jgi:polysaccharide biosynthesis PFTS motif protein
LRFWTINDVGYFDERKDLRFLNDLVYVAQRLNVVLLHKPKRNLPIEERTPRYASLLQELINHPNYQRIDAEVSPHQLIMEADLVISVPITSTALIAKNLGKPSIYYDSIGKLDSSDPVLRNIELIQNPKDLQEKIRLILLSIAKQ